MEPGMTGMPSKVNGHAAIQPPNTCPPDTRLTVELKRDLDLLPEDAAALNALVESRPEVGVFVSTAWLSGYFADPPDGSEPSLALLRQGRALRGVVPVAIRHASTAARVCFLGGGHGSDRVDLLAARGYETACSDAFVSWLADAFGRRSFILELRDVPATSPVYGAVHRAARARTLPLVLQPCEIHAHPYLDLHERSVRAPAAAPEARNAPSLVKHRRWLESRGTLTIETLDHPGEVLDGFDALARFLHARWHGRSEQSALDNPRALRFHRRALPLLLSEGRLRMIRLAVDARTVGVFYGLAAAGWRGYYLAGYDREWAGRIHLGQITLAAAIDAAFHEGAVEFDFLKGAEPVKYLWPVRERATFDADVYSVRSGAQLERARRATRDAAAALAKSARTLIPE
jgi:CelD/BcsL family acetyltransferase involved in cellulose biosynthesis